MTMWERLRQRVGLSRLKLAVLLPLAAFIVVLASGLVFALHQSYETEDLSRVQALTRSAETLFRMALEKDADMMAASIQAVMKIDGLQSLFLARDRKALYQVARPLFDSLRKGFDITHFYFTGPDRVNVLRVHQAARHGDIIDRETTLRAVRDGKSAQGLELGPLGTFTLRVVTPWRTDEGVIGYLELGKEIDNIICAVGGLADMGVYAFVPKRFVERGRWEEGMRMLGRTPYWGQFRELLLMSNSGAGVPSQLVELVDSGFFSAPERRHEQHWDERYVRLADFPVTDVGGQVRAYLLLVEDVTNRHYRGEHLLMTAIGICLIIGAGLVWMFWLILERVEASLAHKEGQLQQNLRNQQIVSSILRASLQPLSLPELLRQALDLVLSSHQLAPQSKGCIFLLDESGKQLVMAAHSGLAGPVLEACARLPLGQCLCGRTAQARRMLHVDRIDSRHETCYQGMQSHGHYCAPILADDRVLGVLNLSVPEGHRYSEAESHFIAALTDTLAGLIQHAQGAAELERQRVLFEAVFRSVPDAMCITNTEREIIDCNPAVSRIFGYQPNDLLGRQTLVLYQSESDFKRQGELCYNVNADRRPQPYVVAYRRKNGETFPGETVGTVIRDKQGDAIGFIGVIRDVSQRIQAEHALQQAHDALEQRVRERTRELTAEIAERQKTEACLADSREQARTLLEAAGDGIYGVDRQGLTTFYNPAAARMLGYGMDDLIGRPMHECIHQSNADGSPHRPERCPMSMTLSDARVHQRDDEVLWREDGSSFPVEYTSTPLLKNGAVAGAVATFRDITGHLEAREHLRGAKEQAEAANLAKSQFLANMSHELRTPLNAILGYSELLMEEVGESASKVWLADLGRINTSGRQLLGLINDVLDLSKIEAGRMDLHSEPFSLRDMLQEVIAVVEPQISNNGNRLEIQHVDAIETMVADQAKVRQVLINLLNNAGKFTQHGHIGLTLRREASPRGDWVVFCVSDTGTGISEAKLGQVFDAFSQGDASTRRQYEGTGLGLAITKHFCTMMGGTCEVESEVNIGSLFTVRLPANQDSQKS